MACPTLNVRRIFILIGKKQKRDEIVAKPVEGVQN